MMNYSKSAALDTLDLVKKILLIIDLFIQVAAIGFLVVGIVTKSGILIANIILLSISAFYFVYYSVSIREFYTKKQLKQKKKIKSAVRISKRLVHMVIIGFGIKALYANQNIDNMNILLTLLLIIGFILAVFVDIVVGLIDQRRALFVNALKQDAEDIKEYHKIQVGLVRTMLKVQALKDPLDVDPKQLEKLKKIKHKYEQKERRKSSFLHKNK